MNFSGARWVDTASALLGTVGTAYPVYVGYVMQGVSEDRRGAAFGAMLAAFDTGVGTGSTSMGWIIQHHGFSPAFGVAAALSALAFPYFLLADRFVRRRRRPGPQAHEAATLGDHRA